MFTSQLLRVLKKFFNPKSAIEKRCYRQLTKLPLLVCRKAFLLDTSRERLLDFFLNAAEFIILIDSTESRLQLKRETVAIGAICLLLGGLIGYISGTQITLRQIQEVHPARNQPGSGPPTPPSQSSLPEGHPTITTSADLETLKKAADAAPNNSTLSLELANKLYDAGRYGEAIPYYKRALMVDPRNVNVSTDLGTALFYTGDPDAAIAQFNRSLEIDPRHAQTLHNLVIVNLQGKKDIPAAKAALERLKSVDPKNPSIPNLQNMMAPSSGTPQANPRQTLF